MADARAGRRPRGRHSRSLLLALALALACLGCGGPQNAGSALAYADRLYDAGQTAAAVDVYQRLYPDAGDRREEVLKRIVGHAVSAGKTATARNWITRGLNDGVSPAYDDPAAQKLADEVRSERDERLAREQPERDRRKARED